MNKNEIIIFLKKLTFAKILNLTKIVVSYFLSIIFRQPVRFGLPYSVSIEPTTYCNLNCPQCPVGTGTLKRKPGNLKFEDFKLICDRIDPYLLNLFLYFQGEPFLNKDIFKMIKYASKEKKIFTSLSTNGHFFSDKNIESIFDSELDKIIVSIDGTTQEIYEKYRKNGDLTKVINGLTKLLNERQKKGQRKPFIELQFLVFKFNEHQMNEIRNLAKETGVDALKFKTAQVYDYENDDFFIPNNEKFSRYKKVNNRWILKKKLKNHCKRLWFSSVITYSGDVLPCCFDKDGKYIFGNVFKEDFGKIVKNDKFKAFAKQLLTDRKSIDICRNCSE